MRRLALRIAREESGMTLVELLNVVFIMGILLAIALPGYLSFKDRTSKSAAQANVRAILPGVAAYGQDNAPSSNNDPDLPAFPNDNLFENMSPALVQQKYAPSLDITKYQIVPGSSTQPGTYCVYSWVGPWTAAKNGPGAAIAVYLSPSFNPVTCSGS